MNRPIQSNPPQVNIANWNLAVKPYEAWGPRTIPDTELVFIHAGRFELELDGGSVPTGKGELLCIRPGERHVFRSLEPRGTISCIHCDPPETDRPPRVQSAPDPEIADAFRRCAAAFLHPAPHRGELMGAILAELLIRLRTAGPSAESGVSERVAEMTRYLREHFDEPVTRNTLAQRFHISPQHINHLFKTELGTSPTALLHLERVKQAFLLIQNERLSVKEAAERTGFCDAYHLSKVFKKMYGFPPGRIARFFTPQ